MAGLAVHDPHALEPFAGDGEAIGPIVRICAIAWNGSGAVIARWLDHHADPVRVRPCGAVAIEEGAALASCDLPNLRPEAHPSIAGIIVRSDDRARHVPVVNGESWAARGDTQSAQEPQANGGECRSSTYHSTRDEENVPVIVVQRIDWSPLAGLPAQRAGEGVRIAVAAPTDAHRGIAAQLEGMVFGVVGIGRGTARPVVHAAGDGGRIVDVHDVREHAPCTVECDGGCIGTRAVDRVGAVPVRVVLAVIRTSR